jgi:hypothetical protein
MSTSVAFMDYDTAIGAYRYIRLTDADPEVSSTYGGQHEEGWSRTYNTWTLEGEAVVFTSYTEGRDCDGRSSETHTVVCPVSEMASVTPYAPDGHEPMSFKVPAWRNGRRIQRDYSAEAAGY